MLEISWPPPISRSSDATRWACVCRLGGVGDNLIAASVTGPLKRKGYKVEVISQAPYSCIFENNPHIDKLAVHVKEDFPSDMLQWQQHFAARAKEYEIFANLSHSCEHLVSLFPAQTAFYWPAHFRRQLCNRSYIETVHDIFGVPYEFGPLFHPTELEREQRETKAKVGERCIGWCLSGSRIDKVYPYAPMAIARLIKELKLPVVMMGAPGKDFEMAKAIEEHVGRQNGSTDGLHLALSPDDKNPTWPIRRILSFAGVCDLVIGPDTGPMWGVAFEAMPKVLMLSHASPENITKHWRNAITLHAEPSRVSCWPCHQLHDEPKTCRPNKENNGAACVSDISVETVLTTIAKAMEK